MRNSCAVVKIPSQAASAKLLEKQKEGKRAARSAGGTLLKRARMREYDSVSIPQEAFIAALRMGDDA